MKVSFSLWDGTDRLILSLNSPEPSEGSVLEAGDLVKHPLFGNGTVIESIPDDGIVTVEFDTLGKRRINQNLFEKR